MADDHEEADPALSLEPRDPRRARLAIAAGATFLLAAIVGIVVVTGSGSGEVPITNECIQAWNEDEIAPVQDGTHAFSGHGYRETLVTRVDDNGNLLQTDDGEAPADQPDARCVVVFAAPQVDYEPDFGVRVLGENGWVGLSLADKLPTALIEAMQAEAVSISNATVGSNGLLTQQ